MSKQTMRRTGWVVFVTLLVFYLVGVPLWDRLASAGPSTRLNATDRMSENIDYVTRLEDAAHSSGDTGVMLLTVRNNSPNSATSPTTGDYVPLQTDDNGNLYVGDSAVATLLTTMDADTGAIKTAVEIIDNNALSAQTLIRQTFVSASLASDGVVTVVTDPAAATAPKIVALVFTQTVQGLAEVRVTGVSGTILAQYYLPAYGGVALAMGEQPYIVGTANESIVIKNKTGASCSYAGHVVYYLE